LLDANARFSLDAKGTTNHCPMALVALAKMGAPPSRLQAFFDYWEREYALLLPQRAEPVARAAWPAQQGRREAFDAVKLCFENWLAEADAAQVLAAVLQQIPAAPGSGAFHAWRRIRVLRPRSRRRPPCLDYPQHSTQWRTPPLPLIGRLPILPCCIW